MCGLCCTGLLFTYVEVAKSEIGELPEPPARKRGGSKRVLTHPCRYLDGCECSIYKSRPKICRDYACRIRRNLLAGSMDANEAEEIVAAAKEMLADLSPLATKTLNLSLEETGFREFCDRFAKKMEKKIRQGEALSEDERQAAIDCFSLIRLVNNSFRETGFLNRFAQLVAACTR